MSKTRKTEIVIPDEIFMDKIYLIRGQKVMLDIDLAKLYNVETKRLNEQVKRNINRFPEDFMFQLSKTELENLKSQIATSSWGGRRKPPNAFTEHVVLMLASVLNSERAIQTNIQIVGIFNKMREMLLTHKDLILKLDELEMKFANHDDKILLIFEYLKQLEQTKQKEFDYKNRNRIGYKRKEDD